MENVNNLYVWDLTDWNRYQTRVLVAMAPSIEVARQILREKLIAEESKYNTLADFEMWLSGEPEITLPGDDPKAYFIQHSG